jgi:hypothetical protein
MSLTGPPLLEMYRSQARAAKEVVQAWQDAPPDAAQFARDIDEVISEMAVKWPQMIEQTYHREWQRAVKGPIENCVPIGETVFDLWDSFTKVLEPIRDLGRSLVARGHTVPHLPQLEAGIDKLQRNRKRAHDNWPWFRLEDEAEAKAEIARGEYVTTEELLREVQDRLARKTAG